MEDSASGHGVLVCLEMMFDEAMARAMIKEALVEERKAMRDEMTQLEW